MFGADGHPTTNARLTILDLTNPSSFSTPVVLRTDALGAFDTRELVAGRHLLVAQASGHAATPTWLTVSEDVEQFVQVSLHIGASVVGTVSPSHAKLVAWPAWAGRGSGLQVLRSLYHLCAVRGLTTDGRYRLEHVPIGTVTLECAAGAGRLLPKKFELEEGEVRRCDFALDASNES